MSASNVLQQLAGLLASVKLARAGAHCGERGIIERESAAQGRRERGAEGVGERLGEEEEREAVHPEVDGVHRFIGNHWRSFCGGPRLLGQRGLGAFLNSISTAGGEPCYLLEAQQIVAY